MFQRGPLYIYLVWGSLCFLDLVSVSFPSLGKFSAFFQVSFLSFFLSLFCEKLIMWILVHLMSLKLSLVFKILFSLRCSAWFSLSYVPDCWSVLPYHLICIRFSLCLFQLLYSLVLIGSFPYFLFLEILTVFIQSSPEFGKHLYNCCFELLIRWVVYLCSGIFLGVFFFNLFCLFTWNIFLCLLICLTLCVILSVNDISYISRFWSSGPIENMSSGPKRIIPSCHQNQVLRGWPLCTVCTFLSAGLGLSQAC